MECLQRRAGVRGYDTMVPFPAVIAKILPIAPSARNDGCRVFDGQHATWAVQILLKPEHASFRD